MIEFLLTIFVAAIGAYIAYRLRVPAGAVIGPMIAVGAFNVITDIAFMPQAIKIIVQILAGAFIGSRISNSDVKGIRCMIKPAIFLSISMLGITTITAIIMSKITILDLTTAFFACSPGGIIDMSLISQTMGADVSKVATMQLIRVMSVIGIFPPLLKFIHSKFNKKGHTKTDDSDIINYECVSETKEIKNTTTSNKAINLVLTILVALVLGFVGFKTNIPAGTIIFSMLSVALLNIFFGRGYMPVPMRVGIQIFAGGLIGSTVTYADIISLKGIILPVIILIFGLMIMNLFIGFILHKVCKLDLSTSLFAAAPGGVTDMALIAQELGADAPKVAILQLARLISVIAFLPIIIPYVRGLFL